MILKSIISNRREYHERKMRQQIRENNQELRELESRLRSAYVSKALYLQRKEIEKVKEAEKIQEHQENETLEQARILYLQQLEVERKAEIERKRKLREDLKNQIISSHQQNQLLYEQFLREKSYLDEIARRIQEELMEEVEKKKHAREQTKKEMEAFELAKREIERIRQIEVNEENERIKIYCEERDKKIEQEEKRRRELELQRDCLNEKMVKELNELIVSFAIQLIKIFKYFLLMKFDTQNSFDAVFYTLEFQVNFIFSVKVIKKVYTLILSGRHCPKHSSNIGFFSTVCL